MTQQPPKFERSDQSDNEHGNGGGRTGLGIGAILVGIAAAIVADQTKLTTTKKVLLGGFYIKDQYREALLYAGVALAILGALLVLVSAMKSAQPSAISSLSAVTGLLLILTLAGGGFVYVAYKKSQLNSTNNITTTTQLNSTNNTTATTQQSAPPAGNYCPPGAPPSSTPTFPSGDPCLLRP